LKQRTALILLGSPGSGKGTQSEFLTTWLGIPRISTGDMLRDHIRTQDAVGREIEETLKAGSLVPDALVNGLVRRRIAWPDCEKGFILDGYPRTVAQAEETRRLLNEVGAEEVVIHLFVDYNVIIARIAGRRVCPVCGTLYNAVSRPPKIDGFCDLDGSGLEVRPDDGEDVVRERLAEYDRQTRPLIGFFEKTSPRFYRLDASEGTPEEIFQAIQARLVE
jgi:adenylate kinase